MLSVIQGLGSGPFSARSGFKEKLKPDLDPLKVRQKNFFFYDSILTTKMSII